MKKRERLCPACQQATQAVKPLTLRHHLLFPFSYQVSEESHSYCANRHCDWSYFTDRGHFKTSNLQQYPAIIQGMVCFCFGVTETLFLSYNDAQRTVFFQQLDTLATNKLCQCRIKNPSGRGCLKTLRALNAK